MVTKSSAYMSGYVSRGLKTLNKYQNPFPESSKNYEQWQRGYEDRKREEYTKQFDDERARAYWEWKKATRLFS